MSGLQTDGEALLATIIANPNDDAPRLIYADWLDENGQPQHAALIRAQCEIAQLIKQKQSRCDDEPDYDLCTGTNASWCPNCGDCTCANPEDSKADASCPLHSPSSLHDCHSVVARRIDDLREQADGIILYNWDGLLPDVDGQMCEWYSECFSDDFSQERSFAFAFHRGFVSETRCSVANWMKHGPAICRHPIVKVDLIDFQVPEFGTKEYPIWDQSWQPMGALRGHEYGELPDALFRFLTGGRLVEKYQYRDYDSQQEAKDDASRACIAWARSQPTTPT